MQSTSTPLKPCEALAHTRKRTRIHNKGTRRPYDTDPLSGKPLCNRCRCPINVRTNTELIQSMSVMAWHSFHLQTFFCNECMLVSIDRFFMRDALDADIDPDLAVGIDVPAPPPSHCIGCTRRNKPERPVHRYDTDFACADAPTRPRQVPLCSRCAMRHDYAPRIVIKP